MARTAEDWSGLKFFDTNQGWSSRHQRRGCGSGYCRIRSFFFTRCRSTSLNSSHPEYKNWVRRQRCILFQKTGLFRSVADPADGIIEKRIDLCQPFIRSLYSGCRGYATYSVHMLPSALKRLPSVKIYNSKFATGFSNPCQTLFLLVISFHEKTR